MMGPVQVLVVGYEQPVFTGEVLAEMARLSDAGLVRLVDVLLVTRAADGTFETVDVADDDPEALPVLPHGNGALAATLLGHSDETGDDREDARGDDSDTLHGPVWSLAGSVPAGTTAAVALIEHVWAAPLRDAIRRTGGVPLDEIWLAEADLQRLAGHDAALSDARPPSPPTSEAGGP
jgi:hypothetical protein